MTKKHFLKSLRWLVDLDRRSKRNLAIAADLVLNVLSVALAFSLRVGALSFPLNAFLLYAGVSTALLFVVLIGFGTYKTIFRFSGSRTILLIGKAIATYAVFMIAIFMIVSVSGVPRTIAIIQPMIVFGLVAGSRLITRYLLADILKNRGFGGLVRKVVIYGAGSSGQQLALSTRHNPEFFVVGFIDDDERLVGQRLDGMKIHSGADVPALIEDLGADVVLLALPNASRNRRSQIVRELQDSQVQVLTLPELSKVVEGHVTMNDLREVRLEDLLGREPVQPNSLLLRRSIVGKTVLITGAGGSIGSELARQIAASALRQLVLVDMNEHALYLIESELAELQRHGKIGSFPIFAIMLNLTDRGGVVRMLDRWQPQTIFHAAAYKHVPLVEANPLSGIFNNVAGTWNMALSSENTSVERFILVSTDKAVRPTNVMGASKRVCELILQALSNNGAQTRFAMVRFGNVLGSSGSVVPRFLQQISAGGPVTLTHRDVTRYFMTIPEAAQLVVQAGGMAEGGELYLLDMGEPVKIYDLAKAMISLSGLTPRKHSEDDGDIEILEIGLRPGEKLYEELLIDDESEKTIHSRIKKAREYSMPFDQLERDVTEMLNASNAGDEQVAIRLLKQLVPEYGADQDPATGTATA